MKYRAKLPDDQVNVSESSMGFYGLKVIGGCVLCLFIAYFTLAMLSDYFVRFIPLETEQAFYAPFGSLKAEDDNVDKAYQDYAKQLLRKIPQEIIPEGYHVSISVMKDKDMNAFAMPGGHIILTTALMDEIDSENGLIFVIGHEIGHFHGRDHLKRISRQILFQVMAALVTGQTTSDISKLETFANIAVDSHYSRDDEDKADEWGVKALVATYGHAGGATYFFEKIMNKYDENEWAELISSHPISRKRMRHINDYILDHHYEVRAVLPSKI